MTNDLSSNFSLPVVPSQLIYKKCGEVITTWEKVLYKR